MSHRLGYLKKKHASQQNEQKKQKQTQFKHQQQKRTVTQLPTTTHPQYHFAQSDLQKHPVPIQPQPKQIVNSKLSQMTFDDQAQVKPKLDKMEIPLIKKNSKVFPQQEKLFRPIIKSEQAATIRKISGDSSFSTFIKQYPSPFEQFTWQSKMRASPHFIRMTTNCLQRQPHQQANLNIPLGILIQPFAKECLRINMNQLIRCSRCNSYINCNYQITPQGYKCNLCGVTSKKKEMNFFNQLNLNDNIFQTSTYQTLIKDGIFFNKDPSKVRYLIILQASKISIKQNLYYNILMSIKSAIQNHQFSKNVEIAIITFNKHIYFYKPLPNKTPHILIVPSQIPFPPLPQSHLFFSPLQHKQILIDLIDYLLSQQEQISLEKHHKDTSLGSAIKSVLQGFGKYAGKILAFSSSSISEGYCKLQKRSKQQLQKILVPVNKQFLELGKQVKLINKLNQKRISLDLFIFGNELYVYFDLATIHEMVGQTGGSLHYYPIYNQKLQYLLISNSQMLYYKIFALLTTPAYFDILYTIRTSNGISMKAYYTKAGVTLSRDEAVAAMDSQSTIMGQFTVDQKNVYRGVQFAILYTSIWGQRVLRVMNYNFFQSINSVQSFQGIDNFALTYMIFRKHMYYYLFVKYDAKKMHDQINKILVNIFIAFKNHCVQYPQPSRIQMVKTMHYLPLYTFILFKTQMTLFKNTIPDYSFADYYKFIQNGFTLNALRLYPKIYRVDNLEKVVLAQGSSLPNTIGCNGLFLCTTGIYIINDGEYIYFLIVQQVPPQTLYNVFGEKSIEDINIGIYHYEVLESELSVKIGRLIDQIRSTGSVYQSVLMVHKGEVQFYKDRVNYFLKEQPRQGEQLGYKQFYLWLHQAIQKS